MTHNIGGVWQIADHNPSEAGRAWPEMKVNISRHTGTFAEFSWQEDKPDFPKTQEVYEYLNQYAHHFQLKQYIFFGCTVLKIFRQETKWIVRWEKEAKTFEEFFDAVIVATGKFNKPNIPNFNGLEKLTVPQLHSAHYRSADPFIGQKVLVVGGSLSGTSIAEELAKKNTSGSFNTQTPMGY